MPISKILEPRVDLPELSEPAARMLRRLSDLPDDDKEALIRHLKEEVRSHKHGTSADLAPTQNLSPGDEVEIVSGALDYIGQVGRVNSAARARVRVTVQGKPTPLYLFRSDVRLVRAAKPVLGKRDSSHLRAVPKVAAG
jgi:transcription antitermination factor NusG